MEKRGIIEPDRTPPEQSEETTKKASQDLEDHPTKRAADAVEKQCIDSSRE